MNDYKSVERNSFNKVTSTAFLNWREGLIMRLAGRYMDNAASGLKGNFTYATIYGLLVVVVITALHLSLSTILDALTASTYVKTIQLNFMTGYFFLGFFIALGVSITGDIINKLKGSQSGFTLLFIVNMLSFVYVGSIIYIAFALNIIPSIHFKEVTETNQQCVTESCTFSGSIVNVAALNENVDANETLKLATDYTDKEITADDIKSMTIEEVEEFLRKSNFKEFSALRTSEHLQTFFEETSLFSESKFDWEKFVTELSMKDGDNLSGMKILTALNKEPPFSVVIDLLNLGYSLDGNHLSALAKYLTIEEFQQLENYGIDLTKASSAGTNVLVDSLLSKDGPELFEYLITKDELVFANDVDIVMQSLQLSSKLNRPIKYTQELIKRGAPFTEATKNWIENDLRSENPDYYAVVRSRIRY